MHNTFRGFFALLLLGSLASLLACSGAEIIPGDTDRLVQSGYGRYGWRSEPLTPTAYSKDKLYQADPAIRAAIEERMQELGYTLVPKADAEFLIDYIAAAGVNDGLLESTSSNVTPYPSATIGRQVDGASVDNAYALGGAKETGKLMIVFLDNRTTDLLWQVSVSSLIQDANKVDTGAVRKAIRQGLSTLPEAP
ncbi:DUF4136 domain-containing protein [Congregibacter litoralis]|uniref:DUF4136 domain-containing protein n=1 Tax=Congregibacter litoralis KT71 TaxID=314285 RepID=A4AC33_9GAMM|nr:DUF4136 domain-containing protein [Congregibacter litoralis]EAQ96483.1 Domain protein of unknown function [Congregibacter litoralis KT71]